MVVAVVKGIPGQLNPTITSLQKSLSAVDRHLLNKITGQPRDKPDLELYRNEAIMLKQNSRNLTASFRNLCLQAGTRKRWILN